jgi:hypothetical protein
MNSSESWTWADLDQHQLDQLKDAEEKLGAEILLAYQTGERPIRQELFDRNRLQAAALDQRQLEQLQDLENSMQVVLVAYQKQA